MPGRLGVALAGIILFVAVALVIVQSSASHGPGFGSGSGGDPPAGGHRTGVEWCVEVEPDDNIQLQLQAKAQIEALLPQVAADEKAVVGRYATPEQPFVSRLPSVVESGCPIGPRSYDPTTGDYKTVRVVSSPGRFSRLIYVLPERPIERAVGRKGHRLTSEEYQCYGDVCEDTASGLYLSEEEVADSALIKYWLYEAAGLGCYRPADALLPFQTPPPGTLNPSEYCDESYDP